MQTKSDEEINKSLTDTMDRIYTEIEKSKKKAKDWATPYGFIDFKEQSKYVDGMYLKVEK